jgi:hypothetical protein
MQLLSLLAQNSSLRCSSLSLHCPSSLLLRLAASRTFAPAGSSPPVACQHMQPNPAPHSLPWVLRHLSTMAEKLTTKVCIIGSRPAAHTAAIYAARAELQLIIFEGFLANGSAAGGQLITTTAAEKECLAVVRRGVHGVQVAIEIDRSRSAPVAPLTWLACHCAGHHHRHGRRVSSAAQR